MNSRTAIDMREVSFGYENGLALSNITFSIGEGELIALIGPNGSGKTTLLKLLLGFLRPSSGQVSLFGRPISSYAPKERARQIAYVPQQQVLSFPLRAHELVALGRYPHNPRVGSTSADLSAVAAALAHTGAEHLKERMFNTLSGGEQQKVLIARALAQSARILLLDEPTLHLDLYYQLDILAALKRLCTEKGLAILTVLHDVNLVSIFADKALMLGDGSLRAFGAVADVVNESSIRDLLSVDMKATEDEQTGLRYFVPRNPLDSRRHRN